MRSVGAEEELLLVDEETGTPRAVSRPLLQYAARASEGVSQCPERERESEPFNLDRSDHADRPFGHIESGLQQEQVEIDTHPHEVLADLEAELRWRLPRAQPAIPATRPWWSTSP